MPATNSDNLKSDQKSAPPQKEAPLNELEIQKNLDEAFGERVSQNKLRRKRDLPAIYQREQVGLIKTNNLITLTNISIILVIIITLIFTTISISIILNISMI